MRSKSVILAMAAAMGISGRFGAPGHTRSPNKIIAVDEATELSRLPARDRRGRAFVKRSVVKSWSKSWGRLGWLRRDGQRSATELARIDAAAAKRERRAAKVVRDGSIKPYSGPTSIEVIAEMFARRSV